MSSRKTSSSHWDEFDRALLDSTKLDVPAPGARDRAARALAAASFASAMATSKASLAASSVAGSGAASATPTAAGTSMGLMLVKALVVGGTIGLGATLVVWGVERTEPATTPASVHSTSVKTPVRERASDGLRDSARSDAVVPAPESPGTGAPPLPRARPAIPDTGKPPRAVERPARGAKTSLEIEVDLLERARSALQRGDERAAIELLDRHRRLAQPKRLVREGALLRIQALKKLGAVREAEELARRLVDEDPRGLVGQRARELVR